MKRFKSVQLDIASQDLGVYVGQNLTSPVRYCGGLGFFSARAERQCMESIGFSPECLSIWLDNMHNTKRECFWVSDLSTYRVTC